MVDYSKVFRFDIYKYTRELFIVLNKGCIKRNCLFISLKESMFKLRPFCLMHLELSFYKKKRIKIFGPSGKGMGREVAKQ